MIILIATGHSENGLCNSNELYKIIEKIKPEVIFEEVTPTKFEGVYKGTRKDSLETSTIKKYLESYLIEHVTVDMDGNEIDERRIQANYNKIARTMVSHDKLYKHLVGQQRHLAELYGFPYLNSKHCSELLANSYMLENQLLPNINHGEVFQMYNEWLNMNDKREDEMIRNIYNYSYQNKYSKALFLVGAAHRKPLIDKILKFEVTNNQNLDWVFDYLDL